MQTLHRLNFWKRESRSPKNSETSSSRPSETASLIAEEYVFWNSEGQITAEHIFIRSLCGYAKCNFIILNKILHSIEWSLNCNTPQQLPASCVPRGWRDASPTSPA